LNISLEEIPKAVIVLNYITDTFYFFFLQLNIANPATGCQKLIEIEDERRV
jgi:hypothetical protein